MNIIISLAGSQLLITTAAFVIAVWYWRQLHWLRDEIAALHKEVARLKLRQDLKKR